MACNSLSGRKYNLAEIQQILRQAGWPENQIAKAAALVIYESNGYDRAYNGCGEDSYGWFQIYRRWWPEFEPNYTNGVIFDPLYNSKAGLMAFKRQGWQAWANSNRKYEQNLNGIAAQSQQIYNSGSGNNVAVISSVQQLADLPQPQPQAGGLDRSAFIVIAVGLGALLLIGNRY